MAVMGGVRSLNCQRATEALRSATNGQKLSVEVLEVLSLTGSLMLKAGISLQEVEGKTRPEGAIHAFELNGRSPV
jgi:hypothetical protein